MLLTANELLNLKVNKKRNLSVQDRVAFEYSKILKYFAGIDEKGLEFYNISEKQRDSFVNFNLKLFKNDFSTNPLGVVTFYNRNQVNIVYHEDLKNCKDLTIRKSLSHEIGHFYQGNSSNFLNRMNVSHGYRYIINAINSNREIALGVSGIGLFATGLHPAVILPVIGTGAYLMNCTSRSGEFDADNFSDKLIPELNYKNMILDTMKAQKEPESDITSYFSENKKFLDIFNIHPSHFSRAVQSEKNCKYYLEYKKENNIPNLV